MRTALDSTDLTTFSLARRATCKTGIPSTAAILVRRRGRGNGTIVPALLGIG
jgi:hypothetical protein